MKESRAVHRDADDFPVRRLLAAGLLFAAFFVYGSLVPFDFHPRSWPNAWHAFLTMPYLHLGPDSREDWVANLLLLIPISFLAGVALLHRPRTLAKIGISVVIFGLCAILAVAVEFTQIFFPPRTVSLNDIIAEVIGSAVGLLLAWAALGRAANVWRGISSGGAIALRAALFVYALLYVAIALLPYDFVLSAVELSDRLRATEAHWFVDPVSCSRAALCAAKLGAEVLATLPLGLLLGFLGGRPALRRAFLIGAALGAAIEGTQLFLVSGISQAASIMTRAVGVAAGVAIASHCMRAHVELVLRHARALVAIGAFPYLVELVLVNGWFAGSLLRTDIALDRLQDVRFIPFYYHYYTAEAVAFYSLLKVAFAYAPIGVAVWSWRNPMRGNGARGDGLARAAAIASVIAFVVEAGKLFVRGQHPDPTNVFIAAAAAAASWRCCVQIARWTMHPCGASADQSHVAPAAPAAMTAAAGMTSRIETPAADDPEPASTRDTSEDAAQDTVSRIEVPRATPLRVAMRAIGLTLGLAVVVGALDYPNRGFILLLWLILYAWVLAIRPHRFLAVTVALLPVLDLAPWSGRFFFDEFDLFVLTTLAMAYARPVAPVSDRRRRNTGLRIAIFGFLAFYAVSVLIGLMPLQPIDANAFSTYYSHYNALRLAKGVLFGLALCPLVMRAAREGIDVVREMTLGTALGLAATVAVVLWERNATVGILDWTHDYRISAMFSEMRVGGAAVDGYLALAIPFVLFAILVTRGAVRIAAVPLLVGAIYAVIVTYSRGAYLAVVAGLLVVLGCALVRSRMQGFGRLRALGASVIAFGATSVIAVAALTGSYMRDRVETTRHDTETRVVHWRDSLDLAEQGTASRLFGIGVGRYPESFLWRRVAGQTMPTYRYEGDGQRTYLRLGGGTLYMNQAVHVSPFQQYRIAADIRGHDGDRGRVAVYVCDKWLLYSRDCQTVTFALSGGTGWEHHEARLPSGPVGAGAWWERPPVRLSLSNPVPGTEVDITRVSLTGADRRELLANGNFVNGGDYWLFTTDDHLPWHAKNAVVHLLVEQGWLGLAFSTLLIGIAVRRLWPGLRQGDVACGALAGSLCGLLVVGVVDSVLDFPRLTLLFILVCAVAIARSEQREAPRPRIAVRS